MNPIKEIKRLVAPATLVLVLINIVVFLFEVLPFGPEEWEFTEKFGIAWWRIFQEKEFYRLFTYMFLHGDLAHIFNNMLVLCFLGSAIEQLFGKARFIAGYLGSGIIAGLASAFCSYREFEGMFGVAAPGAFRYSIGASGAIFGLTGAMIYIVIKNKGNIQGISLGRLLMFAALSIYAGISSVGIDNVAHIAGAAFGFLGAIFLYSDGGKTR